ncbi:glutamate-gated chloride channel-like isoform X2 [Mercenaria mercenaria]|uniref:glutamate-gated chloride channel-like isoform X2 n=1 Tax=Mercenaria mercenaria TaxID=6596 RepID=UPI00234F820A|nr:glutamate-gated chloride channel-like isoform X2 [Mercenaria mercenaria]
MITVSVITLFILLNNIIFIVNSTSTGTSSGTHNISKYELLHYLLNQTRYDASIPPDYSSRGWTDVYVQLAIHDINSENEQNMEFSSLIYIRMNWTDHRLNYSANATYDVLKVSGSYINRVWVPDIYFHQDRKANFLGFIGKNELIYIGRNGNIRYSGRISTTMLCRMDLTLYPNDIQHCQITIQSYAYTKEDVLLHWKKENPVIVSGDNIKDYPRWRNNTFSPQCDEPGIQLKRTPRSFSQYISTPVVLVSIAMTSFSFGDNFTPRVTLSGASMTTIIMHWAGIYNKIQPAAALVWLDEWMLINLCFVGGIILFTAIISHVKHPKEIAGFKHLMEESITIQLERCRKRWPEWNEVKTWKPDKKNKQVTSTVDEETTLDDSLAVSTEKDLRWTVDRRFYAVKNDELREKYYKEF